MPRTGSRTTAAVRISAATAIALGTLSLTGCASGTGTRDEGAATLVVQATDKHSTVPQPASNRRTARKSVPCTGANTEVAVTEVSRPLHHLLITATNIGTRPCDAYNAPYLRFDDAQAPADTDPDSVPQAVVTLEPGESAYAGVALSTTDGDADGDGDGAGEDGAEGGHTAHRLGLLFANRAMDGGVGPEAAVQLPSSGVYVDGSARTTYWQQSPQDALIR
ncbi:DUF4232 domain-containing protein [Streptomyces sp. NPDC004732]|uniref:DUF4232 domain-containing protein n=1 Tax=Streptomyces sp. NPDC004732 TaxID=3154290 RepID=UPI0033A67CD5